MQLKFIEEYKIIKKIQTKLEDYVGGKESNFIRNEYWNGTIEDLEDELFSLISYYLFDNSLLINKKEEIKFYKVAKYVSSKIINEYIKTHI